MKSIRFLHILFAISLFAHITSASASSFESQQSNNAIFDGILGESGHLSIDTAQNTHRWAGNSTSSIKEGFAYRKLTNDFHLVAQLDMTTPVAYGIQITEAHVKQPSEFIFRCTLDSTKKIKIDTSLTNISKTQLIGTAEVLKLERKANNLILYGAKFGDPLAEIGRWDLGTRTEIFVGAFRQFGKSNSTLSLKNWRWVIPAWTSLEPYKEFIGSRLEILDTVTGERRVIYETAAGIEAPNWTGDGDNIIYDAGGRVYRLHLPSKKVSLINTGFTTKNYNDHVVAYQNKFIGLTHLDNEEGEKWTIYKLPFAGGGEPLQLTFKSPAYLHGWSPDGSKILYTAVRNGQYDIFQTTADGSGDEIQLTNSPELDDGPEYSPDGKFIYYNTATQKGTHIWRMDANGKNAKQLTNDEFRDWFPHVSPDGQSLVFMSYLPDVPPDLHMYYQPIYLRQLNLKTGKVKIIAYLYGGQGTINVPSWSSDSRYVAFVSNTQLGTQIKH